MTMKIVTYDELNAPKSDFFDTARYENLPDADKIIEKVKKNGDGFIIEISKLFGDGNFIEPSDFVVKKDEIENAYKTVGEDFINHIKIAKKNVENFAKKQLSCIKNLDLEINNSYLGHRIIPLNRVLAYAPGGNYPLPSSAIMTVVPAKVAGVKEVVLTSPKIKPETIIAADIAGADKIYKLGGAQAVAAFAFGTETIAPVDKIVGPGNKYVTHAKKSVFGACDIDFLAGPSEVLIIADETAKPEFVAADMLAQSEHDMDARAYLVTFSVDFAQKVQNCAENFLKTLPTAKIAAVSFEKATAVIVKSVDEAILIANRRAPEHLELMVREEKPYLEGLTNYGSLFIGESCAEVFGDYASGTNHVLPTNSAARYTGGLSVFDFIKIVTYQKIDKSYARTLSSTASSIAEKEGLFAHKLASDLRGKYGCCR